MTTGCRSRSSKAPDKVPLFANRAASEMVLAVHYSLVVHATWHFRRNGFCVFDGRSFDRRS